MLTAFVCPQTDEEKLVAFWHDHFATQAKDVTKRRLYLEAMKDLIPKLGPKYIVDEDQRNLLPLLNLGKQIGVEK